MNRYARDMLMRRRDMRNPYGSRGGYVVNDRAMEEDWAMEDMARGGRGRGRGGNRGGGRGRDRAMDYGEDWADYAGGQGGGQGGGRDNAMDYGDYARGGRGGRGRDNAMDYGDYAGGDGGYGMGMFDYADYGDYAGGQDGAQKLARRELKKWEKGLENADGTKGAKWQVDQIKQIAQQQGIKFDEYRPETFAVLMNALYADYAKVLGADPIMYAKLTKAWLEDDDFDGEPEEKAMLYYKCIVSKDD